MIALITLTVLTLILTAAISYSIGKQRERLEWNKLIRDGKIPRPNIPNIDHSEYWANS